MNRISILCIAIAMSIHVAAAEEWQGLTVEPEERCAPYKASNYRYSATADARHVERLGWTVDMRRKVNGQRNVKLRQAGSRLSLSLYARERVSLHTGHGYRTYRCAL